MATRKIRLTFDLTPEQLEPSIFSFISNNNWDFEKVKYLIQFEMLCHQDTVLRLHRLRIVIL